MKLYEILDMPKNSRKLKRNVRWPDDENRLGRGIQSTAYAHPKRNTVVKRTRLDTFREHTYVEFVQLCLEHQDNPFFPKFYTAKKVQEPVENDEQRRGKEWLITEMERLVDIEKPKIQEALLHKLINDGFLDVYKVLATDHNSAISEVAAMNFDTFSTARQFDELYSLLDYHKGRDMLMSRSPNGKLRQALTLLKPLFDEHHADMHAGNAMARISAGGPQLVFVDPLLP